MSSEEQLLKDVGGLISSVIHLTTAVETLTTKVEMLEGRLNTGKGIILGLMISAAAIGGSIGAFFSKITKVLDP